jgi:hypothetical protein
MIWDFLHRLIYWRQIRRENEEIDAMGRESSAMQAHLDRRIAEVFTPEEWEATRKRCEAQLRSMGGL